MRRLVRGLLLGGVRRTILLLLLAIMVPDLLIEVSQYRNLIDERRVQEARQNLELARSTGSTLDAYVEELLHQELVLGTALSSPLSASQAGRLLEISAGNDDKLTDLNWISPQCRVIASSAIQNTGQEFWSPELCRSLGERDWVVSNLVQEGPARRPSLIVLRAIRSRSGPLLGVVGGTLDPQRLGRAVLVDTARDRDVQLVDTQGRLVYRHPEMDVSWDERHVLDADPHLATVLAGGEVSGTFEQGSEQRRILGSTRDSLTGWAISVSLPEDTAMGPVFAVVSREAGSRLWVLAAALVLFMVIGRNITVPLHRLRQSAIALGEGRLDRRVRLEGPHELRALGASFNRMAEEIEAREAVLERYHLLSLHARDIILFLRPDGSVIEANHAALRAYGHPHDRLLRLNISALLAEGLTPSLIDRLEEAGEDGLLFETAAVRQDGTLFPAEVSAQSATIGGERVVLAIIRDVSSRKAVEDALRQSESRYRTLAESDPDLVFVFDAEGRATYLNSHAVARFGLDGDSSIGWTLQELFPADGGTLESLRVEVFETGLPIYHEWEAGLEGCEACLGTWLAPIRDDSGRVTAVMTVSRDMTERKAMERALLESEQKYRSLLENIPDAAWTADSCGNPVFASANIVQIKGYTVQEVLDAGRVGWVSNIHPEDVAHVREGYRNLFAGSGPYDVEYRLRQKDGDWIWVHDRSVATYERDGVTYADGIISNITERKTAEEEREKLLAEVRQRAAELDAVISSIADAVVIYNNDAVIIHMNPAAADMFGFTEAERILPHEQRMALTRVETLDGQRLLADDLPALRALRGESVQGLILVVHRRAGGETVWVSASGAPIYGADGRLLGAVSVFTDISALHRLEEQREGFVSLVSHDLRNPLTVIHGHAQTLLRRAEKIGLLEQDRRSAQDILTAAKQMNAMIQDLVDSIRLESGQLYLEKQTIHLEPFLDDLLMRNGPVIETGRIRTDVASGLPAVEADPDRLERVVLNLLTNALKYSKKEVRVHAVAADGDAVITVEDGGAGIAPEDLPHIFERFYRTRSGRKPGGLGLGLYISRMLVEAQGGHIWAESQVDQGSKFHFTLHLA